MDREARTTVRPRGFTLVEMLVVVSISLIVAAVTVPAVTTLAKGAARRSAVTFTMGVLDQARAVALSQGVAVSVAFADADPAFPQEYRYRACAIFREVHDPEQRDDAAGGNEAGGQAKTKAAPYRLEFVRPWTKLPKGVAFRPMDPELLREVPKASFPFISETAETAGNQPTDVELRYLRFNAMGLLERPDGKPWDEKLTRFHIFEGFVDPAGQPVVRKTANINGDETVAVSTITGRARRETPEAGSGKSAN